MIEERHTLGVALSSWRDPDAVKRAAEPPDEPELLVPLAQFEESLGDRIARGEELHTRDITVASEDFDRRS
jgi:hypothetical protein